MNNFFIGLKSDHCLALSLRRTVSALVEFCSNWIGQSCYIDLLKMIHAFLKIILDLLKLIPGFLQVVRQQSHKNPVSASAMLTGKFLQIRKVFATSSFLAEEFPDTLQYKISR